MTKRFSKSAAYHEAGHAAVRAAIGLEIGPIEIRSDGSGLTHGTGETITLVGQYSMWDYVAYSLAGPYAEARATKVSAVAVLLTHGHEDYLDAQPLIEDLVSRGYASDSTAAWRRAERETRDHLRREWPVIVAMAERLRTDGRLEADAIAALAGSAAQLPQKGELSE